MSTNSSALYYYIIEAFLDSILVKSRFQMSTLKTRELLILYYLIIYYISPGLIIFIRLKAYHIINSIVVNFGISTSE